jgi:hypothetical protein
MGHTTDVICTMRGGAAARTADAALRKVVEAVEATGKKGSITIKMTIAPLKGGDTELDVDISITNSIPVESIPKGIFYPKDGELVRDDPRQLTLDGTINSDGKTIDIASRRFNGATGNDI